jgi:hypothetical protein
MQKPLVFYKEEEETSERCKTHYFYVVRDALTGYDVQQFTFTTKLKRKLTDWQARALDDKEQLEVKMLMEEMGYTSVGDCHDQGISPEWLKLMGLQ